MKRNTLLVYAYLHLNYRKIEILNFIYIQLRVYFVLYIISFLLNIKCIHRTRILYNIRKKKYIYIVCVVFNLYLYMRKKTRVSIMLLQNFGKLLLAVHASNSLVNLNADHHIHL